ncbi:1-aminocyclopropane-1-carboxylate deaminase [Bienertia sinuspersici]
MGNYWPLRALTWHNVEEKIKFDILKKMREHFIIPNDEVYDKLALQRKTKEQHYDPVLCGHTTNGWIKLVNYWFSPKGQKLSQIGKEACPLQSQTHIMGANSYANMRADYVSTFFNLFGVNNEDLLILFESRLGKRVTATEDFLVYSTCLPVTSII